MNCQEFHRRLLIEPRSRDEDFANHATACPECARRAEQALRFEDRLVEALTIPSPIDMESRFDEARAKALRQNLPAFSFRWLGMAAGSLLAIGMLGWLGYDRDPDLSVSSGLPVTLINHIHNELEHLHGDEHVRPGTLAYLLSQFGADMLGDIGSVTYAGRCLIGRHHGLHLVLSGREGPVTVLMMPGEHRMRRERVGSTRFSGVIVPTSYGSLAVIGEKREPVEQIVDRVQKSILWNA